VTGVLAPIPDFSQKNSPHRTPTLSALSEIAIPSTSE
jgi:hypothetical protein